MHIILYCIYLYNFDALTYKINCRFQGWDKTFCLKHIEGISSEIYFFGDKTDIVRVQNR